MGHDGKYRGDVSAFRIGWPASNSSQQHGGSKPSMHMGKCAFVLVDGIGDVSVPTIGSRTPLQLADTPVLDAIASAHPLSSSISVYLLIYLNVNGSLITCRCRPERAAGPSGARACLRQRYRPPVPARL